MKKFNLIRWVTFVCTTLIAFLSKAQQNELIREKINSYYKLGLEFKDGNNTTIDYSKAYEYFQKAAELGDEQSVYAIAYMHYKGLGCNQDYTIAADLFYQGALRGKDNSMYFYGLCWKNGYGRKLNQDSAKYWLIRSARMGYVQAKWELNTSKGENNIDSIKLLLERFKEIKLPHIQSINTYNRVIQSVSSKYLVSGAYKGFLIQYDWSGNYIISGKEVLLDIDSRSDELVGKWKENHSDSITKIYGHIEKDSIYFRSSKYNLVDHYSNGSAVEYSMKSARLQIQETMDSVFIVGNIEMFSNIRKEPSKPFYLILAKKKDVLSNLTKLSVDPNPFTTLINVRFTLPKKTSLVEIQLLNSSGSLLYKKNGENMEAGRYNFPLQPQQVLAAGVYFIKLVYDNNFSSVKILKK
jgi:uncharacterized protein